ncbi:hypothetical protein [Piscirickettsia salmonis]|uniref:hypothetical protein n=1 Tax=Piscirickettsia salmonis TaxID=1238 RepID=UPI0007C8D6CB|nr:hypothetical protein A0O36_02829 [Piscirickettsiaceae bacterium NZ-RLO1]
MPIVEMKTKIDINLQHDQLSQSPVRSCRTYKACQGILNTYATDEDHLKKTEVILMAYIQNNPDIQFADVFDIAESIACMKVDKLDNLLSMYSAGNLMTTEIIQQFSSELEKKAAMNALRRQNYDPFEANGFSFITCENKSKFLSELSQKAENMGLQTLEDLRKDLLEGETDPKVHIANYGVKKVYLNIKVISQKIMVQQLAQEKH